LNPDGSEDAEILIKDLPNMQVGDWRLPEEQEQEQEREQVETGPIEEMGFGSNI
jgi:hypothetical protein